MFDRSCTPDPSTNSLCPQLMSETSNPQTLIFRGERMTWVSPATLDQLVELKSSNPKAPLVVGNTNVGEGTPVSIFCSCSTANETSLDK